MENSSKSRRATKHTVPILWIVNITQPRVGHIQQLCSLAHAVTPKPSLKRWRVQYAHDSGVDLGPLGLEWWTQELMRCVWVCVHMRCISLVSSVSVYNSSLARCSCVCCKRHGSVLWWIWGTVGLGCGLAPHAWTTAVDDGPGTVGKFGYAHIHSRSMASQQQRHFLRSNTQTWEREERLLWLMGCTW